MQLLFRSRCTRIETITIDASTTGMVTVSGIPLDPDERELLAQHDGFENWDEMLAFWEGRLPFKGKIIHWAFPPEGPQ